MSGIHVVQRYARALYSVGEEKSLLKELDKDMKVLERLFHESPEIREYCFSCSASVKNKRDFIDIAFLPYVGDLTSRTIELMFQNNRLEVLPFLSDSYQREKEERSGITPVVIEYATEPEDQMKEDISGQLRKKLDGKVHVQWQLRPEIRGGLTFQWNNRFLDYSLAGRLQRLKSLLKRKR